MQCYWMDIKQIHWKENDLEQEYKYISMLIENKCGYQHNFKLGIILRNITNIHEFVCFVFKHF